MTDKTNRPLRLNSWYPFYFKAPHTIKRKEIFQKKRKVISKCYKCYVVEVLRMNKSIYIKKEKK